MKAKSFYNSIKKIGIGLLLCVAAGLLAVAGINIFVIFSTVGKIVEDSQVSKVSGADCIIVLGAGVKADGTPSLMLKDRLDKAVWLYEQGVSEKILVSGDHSTRYYDEVNVMKRYLIKNGVPSENIFMDHAGLCTYDTMYRGVHIFGIRKAVIVTQKYHMYRAIFDAETLGMEAYGVCAEPNEYGGQFYRDIREVAARIKDCLYRIIKPESEITGGYISIDGNGDVTND